VDPRLIPYPSNFPLSFSSQNLVVAQTQQVIQTILLSTSPQPRLILPFLTLASADKTPRARSFAQQHLKTYVDHHGSRSHARSTIEASNGVDVLEKVLKTGLGDPAPVVKVEARLAWGSFIRIWAERGRRILEGLEGVARKA
jgi:CLIP-associating protein 1/2